jgi:methionyl aminopeptidase
MITIKNKQAILKMEQAGSLLATIFNRVSLIIKPGLSTFEIDAYITDQLRSSGMVSKSKGYMGYRFASCVSVNDVVVHGIPSKDIILHVGDLVKVDVCGGFKGYCADMARCFFVGNSSDEKARSLVQVTQAALNAGIEKAYAGNRLGDISAVIQTTIEERGYGIVRDFAGHGIGKQMHEEPELLNYGTPGQGPLLRPGMALAIEPMVTLGHHDVYIASDGWTVKTKDKSMAAHIEDTVIITDSKPKIITRQGVEV